VACWQFYIMMLVYFSRNSRILICNRLSSGNQEIYMDKRIIYQNKAYVKLNILLIREDTC